MLVHVEEKQHEIGILALSPICCLQQFVRPEINRSITDVKTACTFISASRSPNLKEPTAKIGNIHSGKKLHVLKDPIKSS